MPDSVADKVREELRRLPVEELDARLAVCDAAIHAAQQRGDAEGAASASLLAAVVLDARGRLDEALARLDFGLLWAAPGSEVRAHLSLTRAGFLAIAGQVSAAREALSEAAAQSRAGHSARARVEQLTYRSHVAAIALDELALAEAHGAVAEAQRAGLDWLASGLVAWLVPWFAAHGLLVAATPWVDWLRTLATEVGHRHREEDALAYGLAVAATTAGRPLEARPALGNQYAAWRLDLLALRDAVLRGDPATAEDVLADLDARMAMMSPGFRDGAPAFRSHVAAHAGLDLVGLAPPSIVTLVSLPAVIAGGEAVALGGTRAEARTWQAYVDALPERLVTSLEWPASVARVRGLLALRAGDVQEAVRHLRAAVAEAERRGAPLEAALAAVQLEALRPVAHVGAEPAAPEASRAILERAGVPAALAAAQVERILERGGGPSTRLTPREVEVLVGLEAGLTYRQIGDRLGVGWRTVQTHAHRLYGKLEASGRHAAIREARVRRII